MSALLSTADHVLVRIPSWLGDAVMAEPVIRALYERHERVGTAARITLAGPERLLALVQGGFPHARALPIRAGERETPSSWRGHDAAILLNGSSRSAWTACAARVPLRAGFARGGRGVLLTQAFTPARERGATPFGIGRPGRWPRWLPRPFGSACIELAGWLGLSVRDRRPRLVVSTRALGTVHARLTLGGLGVGEPFVLANAGARPGSAKGVPAESYARALDALAREPVPLAHEQASIVGGRDLAVVIACAPGEEQEARATAATCQHARVVLLDDPPLDLAELVALTSLARVVIGPDSGPRHLAVALGVPVVAICGPTDPRHTAENLGTTAVVRVVVPCGPCHREVCPLTGEAHHACMRRIDPGAIARGACELLRWAPRSSASR